MRTFLRACAAVSLLAGCSPKAQAPSGQSYKAALAALQAIRQDGSTPDRALKSIWAARDAEDAVRCAAKIELLESRRTREIATHVLIAAAPARLVAGNVATSFNSEMANARSCSPPQYERDIREVRVETQSRAVIVARIRNTTPIPPGAVEDEYTRRSRKNGETYRYIFARGKDRMWKLEDVWSVDDVLGDRSIYGGAGKPSVSTLTWPL